MDNRIILRWLPSILIAFTLIVNSFMASEKAFAGAPALRDQISLNGTWPTGGKVPYYDSQNTSITTNKIYQCSATVPSTWSGKTIKLEFGAVNYVCDIYINGTKVYVDDPVLGSDTGHSHVGAWVPFTVDITKLVTPGQSFTLKLNVLSKLVLPTSADKKKPIWWIGHNDNESSLDSHRCGIVDDVWLRAYGKVHIDDTFVTTSTRNGSITVRYEVSNDSASSWTGNVISDLILESSGATEKTLTSTTVTLAPGETKVVTTASAWSNPKLWWPDDPKLYLIKSRLSASGAVSDSETRRFGFREAWVEGPNFKLNGIRVNLRGDWCCYSQYWGTIATPATLQTHYTNLKKTNANILRWHKHPAPKFAYDMADEMGIMILAETAYYARGYMKPMTLEEHTAFIERSLPLVKSFIKGLRNNPSIVIWSGCNEMSLSFAGPFTTTDLAKIGTCIRTVDVSRPISYDGDYRVPNADIFNRHYPEGYENSVSGNPYTKWAGIISTNTATYFGEIMAVRSDNDNNWWIGVWTRGLRYLNAAGIAPRVFYPTGRAGWGTEQQALQKAAYHPIALFDKDYDQLGITPFKDKILPTLVEGSTVTRNLVVYNDDYRNTSVDVVVTIKVNGTQYATGKQTYTIALGAHKDITAKFQVPNLNGNNMEMVLQTYKGGVLKFAESRFFVITDGGLSGSTSSSVTLTSGDPTVVNTPPTVSISSPASGSTYTAPANVTVNATASDANGSVTQVSFYNNGSLVSTDSTAPYSCTLTSLAAGTYTLTAKATDNANASTMSSQVTITVNAPANVAPSVSITSPAANATYTAPASVLLQANASDSDGSVSKVEFYMNGSLVRTENVAPYSYTLDAVAAGSYTVTAKAYDNSGAVTTSSPVNITVKAPNIAPSVSITSPAANATYTAPASVLLEANASDSDGTISKVEFYMNGSLVRTENVAPYSYTLDAVAAGSYTITAKAYDNSGAVTTSSPVNITVKAPNVAPSVSITAPTTTTFLAPANITVTANASDSDGSISKVDFYSNGALVGTATAAPYSCSLASLAAGTYNIEAKATDNAGATATASLSLNVYAQLVKSYSLINADTDTVIGSLNNGDKLTIANLPPHINIRANTSGSVGSVMLVLSGPVNRTQVENGSPFCLFSNSGTNYFGWAPVAGSYTLKSTPYSGDNKTGTVGGSLSINFTLQ